jgi:tight adherence protein B
MTTQSASIVPSPIRNLRRIFHRLTSHKEDMAWSALRDRVKALLAVLTRLLRRVNGPYLLPGVLTIALVTAAAWAGRKPLNGLFLRRPAAIPAAFAALLVAWAILAGSLWVEYAALRRWWLGHTVKVTGIASLAQPSAADRLLQRIPDPLEFLFSPLRRTRIGMRLVTDWRDAGLGTKPSRYLALLAATALVGFVLGNRIAGGVLGLGAAILLPVLPVSMVRSRAEAGRRRFAEQLPQTLDALASGLSAGLSFQQAIRYAAEELPEPSADAIGWLDRRIQFGQPVEAALRGLESQHPEESFALVVDGIVLQRQFGGDLVDMFGQIGGLLRERLELEQEVRAVTAQGRLSGWIIAALVPVSAGMLLTFNPRYVDVLFDSVVGQVLLVLVMILQLAGWAIISRLVRIRY